MPGIATLSTHQKTQLSLALLTLVVLALHALVLFRGNGGLMVQGKGNATVFSVRMLPAGGPAAAPPDEAPPTEDTPADIAPVASVQAGTSPAVSQTTPPTPAQRHSNGSNLGAGPSGANSGGASAEMLDHSVPLADGFDLDNRPIGAGRAQGNVDAAVRIPGPMRLIYKVQGLNQGIPITETAELRWSHDAKTYEARLTISRPRIGSRVQTSKGVLNAQGLEPVRYGDKTSSELATHFQRDKGKVIFSANSPEMPWHAGMQDPLSALIQLSALWSAAPGSYPQGAAIGIETVGTRTVEPWVFQVGALETVLLPGSAVQAVRLVREPVGPYGNRSEIWLAPSLGYLPVRIRTIQANGNVTDLQWSETLPP